MQLRFPSSELSYWASEFEFSAKEQRLLGYRATVERNGFLRKPQLRLLANWKAPRSAPNIERNSANYVEEITRLSLSTSNERARIEALTLLDGVQWPTASVVLHFFHVDKYPILDFRALWSLSTDVPSQYTFPFWETYVHYCRKLSRQHKLTMRELDKALWQYSKCRQLANERPGG